MRKTLVDLQSEITSAICKKHYTEQKCNYYLQEVSSQTSPQNRC